MEVVGNPKYKKIYISGPITDMPNKNIDEFEKYEQKFNNLNFEVINPHKLHSPMQIESFTWSDFMRADIKAMMDCDLVAVLPGWDKSKGANLEVYIARSLAMPIIDATNLQLLGVGAVTNLNV